MKLWMAFIIIVFGLIASNAMAGDRYPFKSAQKKQQFKQLTQELRCLVCQNENLASSNASLAADLRAQVYHMVKAGDSSQQIKAYMVARYGDFILFKPPLARRTFLLWFGPLIFLIIGFVIIFFVVRKRRQVVELSDDEQLQLKKLLKQ